MAEHTGENPAKRHRRPNDKGSYSSGKTEERKKACYVCLSVTHERRDCTMEGGGKYVKTTANAPVKLEIPLAAPRDSAKALLSTLRSRIGNCFTCGSAEHQKSACPQQAVTTQQQQHPQQQQQQQP